MNLLNSGLGLLGRNRAMAGFNPLSLSPFQWLSASYGVEKTAGVAAVNNDAMYDWLDKSGNGANAINPSGVTKATYLATGANGKPTLQFNNSYYLGTLASAVSNTNISIVIVAGSTVLRRNTLFGLIDSFSAAANNSSYNLQLGLWTSNSFVMSIIGGKQNPIVVSDTNFAIYSFIISSTAFSLYINGILIGTGTIGTPVSKNYFVLGGPLGGENNLVGLMSECFAVQSVLSTDDHAKLVNYFKEFYSIS
jgi:hypothetical protein